MLVGLASADGKAGKDAECVCLCLGLLQCAYDAECLGHKKMHHTFKPHTDVVWWETGDVWRGVFNWKNQLRMSCVNNAGDCQSNWHS